MPGETREKAYTVHQVARMAQISVRTLHHYDQIGLLKPGSRSESNYRLYVEKDLLQLQQILFFRELGFPLEQIGRVLADPHFDQVEALRNHRQMLEHEAERILTLLTTVDRTILRLTENTPMLSDDELYEGLSRETAERYQREANQMYDPKIVAEANRRVRSMSKEQWKAVKQESDDFTRGLAQLMDQDPGCPPVQALIARHHAWIENFYTAGAEIYRGLGELYTSNDEFRANYDRYRPGLADFMQKAMTIYADQHLS